MDAKRLEGENSVLMAFFMGGAIFSSVTLAICCVFVQVSQFPLWAAYGLLGLVVLVAIGKLLFWFRKKVLIQRLLGVDLRDLSVIVSDTAANLKNGELIETAGDRAREVVAWWSAIQIRKGLLLFLGLLLGQLVLMITAAMLVQQTGALFTQNERIQAQTRLLEAQNEIMRGQSADERIRRSISDMRSLNEVDYGRIVEIAKDIRSLSLGRRKDTVNFLAQLFRNGKARERAFIERNEFSASTNTKLAVSQLQIAEQFEYFAVFLLLRETGYGDQYGAYWIELHSLDLSRCALSGADLSSIRLFHCEPGDALKDVAKGPQIKAPK